MSGKKVAGIRRAVRCKMKLRYGILFAVAGLCLLALPSSVHAQKISGRVFHEATGTPAEGISVRLQRLSGEELMTAMTLPHGGFEFARLEGGLYYVVISEEGYQPVRVAVDLDRLDVEGLMLYLVRLGDKPRPQEASVTVKQLNLSRKARDAFKKAMDMRYKKRNLRGSLPLFELALNEEPANFEAHYEMGLVYMQLELPNAAEDSLRKSIDSSDETFVKAYTALAALLSDQGKHAEAGPLAQKAVGMAPEDWRTHYELGRALLALGRLDDAEASLEYARRRRPDYADLYLLAANLFMKRNNLQAVKRSCQKYLELAPDGSASASVRATLADVEKQLVQQKPAPKP